MLTILVLAPPDPALDALADSHPSVEILRAHDLDEALEKLGRNRRIDAVLLAGPAAADAAEILSEIHEDNPAPPPVFVPAPASGGPLPSGARELPAGPPAALLDALIGLLTAES